MYFTPAEFANKIDRPFGPLVANNALPGVSFRPPDSSCWRSAHPMLYYGCAIGSRTALPQYYFDRLKPQSCAKIYRAECARTWVKRVLGRSIASADLHAKPIPAVFNSTAATQNRRHAQIKNEKCII
ncbi:MULTISPECIES: hypothetical protein [unclassified Microcoleus]|uniref:hypothetical protein n=1 Tax=unclassified Microcoleus TaxID=2642155 RepID=UPI0025DBDE58|nr:MULTISPECIES: hypothetical protein [unclassified Microcoleus]